jgi:ATP-dependent exoDNAse (exonuclease V), alpha subunit - helicase superfamily I member
LKTEKLEGVVGSILYNERTVESRGIMTVEGKSIPIQGVIPPELTGMKLSVNGAYKIENGEKVFKVSEIKPDNDWNTWYKGILPEFPPRELKKLALHGKKAWEYLAQDRECPEGLDISPDVLQEAKKKIHWSVGVYQLVNQLLDKGFTKRSAAAVVREEERVRVSEFDRNVYSLALIPEIPFTEMEWAAKREGYKANDSRRLAGAVVSVYLNTLRQGHTGLRRDLPFSEKNPGQLKAGGVNLRGEVSRLLLHSEAYSEQSLPFEVLETTKGKVVRRIKDDLFEQAIASAVEHYKTEDGRKLWLSNPDVFAFAPLYWKEIQLAQSVVRLRGQDAKKRMIEMNHARAVEFLNERYSYLDNSQKEAILAMIEDPFVIWTGGPGTGKTSAIIAAVDLLFSQGISSIALCATTGMAALNMHNAIIESSNSEMQAFIEEEPPQTGHALLKLHVGSEQSPYKYSDHPLDTEVLFCDEFSMADTIYASTLLWALASGTRVVLIGDPLQIPSVGPGSVLYDLTYGLEKKEITNAPRWHKFKVRHRNNSYIAQLSDTIWFDYEERKQAFYKVLKKGIEAGEIEHYSLPNGERGLEKIREIVQQYSDVILDYQKLRILSPRYEGEVGTNAINHLIQDLLHRGQQSVWGFRLGDRVLQITPDRKNGIRNGELGEVVDLQTGIKGVPPKVVVAFSMLGGNERIIEHVGMEIGKYWSLGFCQTVHKSQGGQADTVLCVLDTKGWYQPLLYTAFTRAKQHLILIEIEDGIDKALSAKYIRRRSQLVKRYQSASQPKKKAFRK